MKIFNYPKFQKSSVERTKVIQLSQEFSYNYLNLTEDEALIESYDDRIEISFNTRKPDKEMVKKNL